MSSLTRIVPWSQQLACEVLRSGDLAVDLTAGKGRDTLALAQAVGPQGQVVAFDVQADALRRTAAFLQSHGFAVDHLCEGRPLARRPGILLVQACHSQLGKMVQHPVSAVIANLGYLPGGDASLVTSPETTLAALQQSLALLRPGGRLAVTVYPAHPGGAREGSVVSDFFAALAVASWSVLALRVANCGEAPYLLVAERTS